MKNIKSILLSSVIACSFFCSCEKVTIDSTQLDMNPIKQEIINDRDQQAYGIFLDVSANDSLNYECLPFSILLADENNPKANEMVFIQMVEVFNKKKFHIESFGNLSEINKSYAFHHLRKAATLGQISAQIYLEEIYRQGIGIEKNERKADSVRSVLLKREGYKEEYKFLEPGMRRK